MIPTHCDLPMIHWQEKGRDIYLCANGTCIRYINAPKGYVDEIKDDNGEDETKLCAYEGCETLIDQPMTGRPREFCCNAHRLRAWRLRQRLEQLSEEVSA